MFNENRFTNELSFIDWLCTKSGQTFVYFDNENCCIAQWAKECGAKRAIVGGGCTATVDGDFVCHPEKMAIASVGRASRIGFDPKFDTREFKAVLAIMLNPEMSD